MNRTKKKRNLFETHKSEALKFYESEMAQKENIPPGSTSTDINFISERNKEKLYDINWERTTPKKQKHNIEEPVTPNTNFKLLTSLAANMDYANCNTSEGNFSWNSPLVTHQTSETDICDDSSFKVNRKEKSLGLICTRFLAMYPIYPPCDARMIVSLDEACLKLGVERRRLYDIVNVFESIDILRRNAKNQYLWFGKNNLLRSLARIKVAGIKENILDKLQYVLKTECNPSCKQSCILNEVQDFNKNFENQNLALTSEVRSSSLPEMRREKSIGIMSQKFLMLFLVSPSKVISLGVAAKVLNGFSQRNERGAQVKTQIRRLYDIANVLSSIDLIQKEVTLAHQGRKPAFKYIGPEVQISSHIVSEVFGKNTKAQNSGTTSKQGRSLVRHSSFQDMCAVAEIERQKLHLGEMNNSAPPLDSSLTTSKISDRTNFSNLILNNENYEKGKITDSLTNSKVQLTKKVLLKPLKMKMHPNFKVMNVPVSVSTGKVPCYVVNNVTTNKNQETSCSYSGGSPGVWIINTSSACNQTGDIEEKKSVANTSPSQTIALSSEQHDAILKSLNISLSSGQIAAIELEGTSQPAANPPRGVLKIINKCNNNANTSSNNVANSQVPILQDISFPDMSTSAPESLCSTRNNSPSTVSVLESPVSIPSGYVTPIHTVTSDISFPSTTEANYILENIVSRQNLAIQGNKAEDTAIKCKAYASDNSDDKSNASNHVLNHSAKQDNAELPMCNEKECSNSLEKISSLLITNDSCSSDSLNSEVSNILQEKCVNETTFHKSFLIDEKTILSPIKKPTVTNLQSSAPMHFFSSYFIPETLFIIDSSVQNRQNVGPSQIMPFPVTVKTEEPVTNNDKLILPTS